MTEKKKIEAKQRIFNEAVKLFAEKGYAGVGIREIAKAAKVNVAMINYYYSSKFGILKEIMKESRKKYYAAIATGFDEKQTLEERTRTMIKNLIEFFRHHFELYMASNCTPPDKLEEIMDLRISMVTEGRDEVNRFFTQAGLDVRDNLLMSMIRGTLSILLVEHFHDRHTWEKVYKCDCRDLASRNPQLAELNVEYNDAYYERYAEVLAAFYLNGVRGLNKGKNQKGGNNA